MKALMEKDRLIAVSYTHLDVYKRQHTYYVYSKALVIGFPVDV